MTKYHPLSEKIVDVLVKKVNNSNRHYFRILVGYYLSKVASMMRCSIQTQERGDIPVNTYVLNLMPSGAGKGHSTNIIEHDFIEPFKKAFLGSIFPTQAEANISDLAADEARQKVANGSILSQAEEENIANEIFTKQFERLGELAFSFDSGTAPAVKQMREKLLLAGAGSMNLELDEIGSNMSANVDVLNTFLELYDKGYIKQKLIKNTTENIRSKELPGNTPTNLMMFGTSSKLLDGGKVEEEFKQFLETGYARRLLFGYTTTSNRPKQVSAAERFKQMTSNDLQQDAQQISALFKTFASRPFNHIVQMSEEDSIYLIEYQIRCEERAEAMKEHQQVHKAEMIHRYYKALKLAGAYAFADGVSTMTKDHLDYAISLVEDSGEQFNALMERKGSYERLANYLADIGKEVTEHEMLEDLPFYKGSTMQRKDLMTLAMSYGYRNNIIIKHRIQDDISFYSGETLAEVDLNGMHVAISTDITQNFQSANPPWDQLWKLTTAEGHHFTAHNFVNQHRKGDNAIPGFDLLILDCDGEISIESAKLLLSDYKFMISTTKRHSEDENRFRLILPMSHYLKLSSKEYSEFMENVFNWLPFDTDTAAKDIARKWETYPGHYEYNDGEILDVTMFIPQTKKADETRSKLDANGMSNMERWFYNNTEKGNRAVHLYRYGMVLIDNGLQLGELIEKIESFNASLDTPLSEEQLRNSTIKSLSKELQKRG